MGTNTIVTGVSCTRIIVVAINRSEQAVSAITAIICAGVIIPAVNNSMVACTAITVIKRAWIVVITIYIGTRITTVRNLIIVTIAIAATI